MRDWDESTGGSGAQFATGFSAVVTLVLAVAAVAGCGRSRHSAAEAVETKAPTPVAAAADAGGHRETAPPAAKAAASQAPGIEELWTAYYLGGVKVGYNYLRAEPISEAGETRIHYVYEDLLMLKRFDTATVVTSKIISVETEVGRPVQFTSEVKTGPGSVVTEGHLAGDQLTLTTRNSGATDQATIRWEPGWGGFFADRQTLRRRPLRPRETRRLKALLPLLNQVGEMQFEAGTMEAVKLLDESRQLLRINVTTVIGRSRLKSVLWTDDQGEVRKMHDEQVGLDAYLTTREVALRPNEAGGFDLGNDAVVRVARPLGTPHQTRRITYRARLKTGDIAGLFATGLSQAVRAVAGQSAEITVTRIRPTEPDTVPAGVESPPADGDRVASTLIQCGDEAVRHMAARVAPDEADSWKLACALERHVKETVRLKGYSTALATAAEVARTRAGDCTEHAMLLAALCRARKIPARVAIGLVYYPPASGFAYHMWTEVWIKDRWIGVDGTLGLGGIGAAHLKLNSSSLQGVSAYAELLPVIQALGRLELELVTVE